MIQVFSKIKLFLFLFFCGFVKEPCQTATLKAISHCGVLTLVMDFKTKQNGQTKENWLPRKIIFKRMLLIWGCLSPIGIWYCNLMCIYAHFRAHTSNKFLYDSKSYHYVKIWFYWYICMCRKVKHPFPKTYKTVLDISKILEKMVHIYINTLYVTGKIQ